METFPLPRGVPNSKVDLKQQVALDDEAKRMVTGWIDEWPILFQQIMENLLQGSVDLSGR